MVGLLLDEDAIPVVTLHRVEPVNPFVAAIERHSRSIGLRSAAHRISRALLAAASADASGVIAATVDVIHDDRDAERPVDLTWRLLRLLGEIGRKHGDEPGVLGLLLPVLHTYLLTADVSLRAQALDAWVEVARSHPVPSSLLDLLPALTGDPSVAVASAVTKAAVALEWPPTARYPLLTHAVLVLRGVDPNKHGEAFKNAMFAVRRLGRLLGDEVEQHSERMVLESAVALDGYDLRDALGGRWTLDSQRSDTMAKLRLRLAADPQINDRINSRDDDELCDLLGSGPGLTALREADLTAAAVEIAQDSPLAAAEFAEVAARAGQPKWAVTIMEAVLAAIPDDQAHAPRREVAQLVLAASQVDLDTQERRGPKASIEQLEALADAIETEVPDRRRPLIRSARAHAAIKASLAEACVPRGTDPSASLRTDAERVSQAGAELGASAPLGTETGGYLRAFAATCEVAAHLLQVEAARLDADASKADAHSTAATARAHAIRTALAEGFAVHDPLAAVLDALLARVTDPDSPTPTREAVRDLLELPLPFPVVRGSGSISQRTPGVRVLAPPAEPARRPSSLGTAPEEGAPSDVAVVLASLDGGLVTGPEVLRSGRVYDLELQVHVDEWPGWADRLDAELVSHLTPAEMTIPSYTWGRADYMQAGNGVLKQSGSLVLRFALGPGMPAPPARVNLTWRGTRDGEPVSARVDVAGHRELRMRPYDATRDRATDFPVFDERLLELYDSLAAAGYDPDQLQAFCRLFTSICRIGLRMTWDRKYRKGTRVSEREFHDAIHDALMADPELGGRVERGSPLALGFLDVRHDGITAELKVERNQAVTEESAPKYMGQPTQYAAADGARLSILAILDMSPKMMPVGTPENYLFTMEPRLHGLENPEAPSLVAALVVNGNMPTPSSWSRRKPRAGHNGSSQP
jgi:hypothetical protein